jgi:hypothetical protein
MITWSHKLYGLCSPVLGIFERKGTPQEPSEHAAPSRQPYSVIIFGLGRFGTAIGLRLAARGVRILGIDFNPLAVRRWHALGLKAEFGDATDPQFVAELPLRGAEWRVSTVPIHPDGLTQEDARTTLIQLARAEGFRGRIATAAHSCHDRQVSSVPVQTWFWSRSRMPQTPAVDLLCGADPVDPTLIPALASEDACRSRATSRQPKGPPYDHRSGPSLERTQPHRRRLPCRA